MPTRPPLASRTRSNAVITCSFSVSMISPCSSRSAAKNRMLAQAPRPELRGVAHGTDLVVVRQRVELPLRRAGRRHRRGGPRAVAVPRRGGGQRGRGRLPSRGGDGRLRLGPVRPGPAALHRSRHSGHPSAGAAAWRSARSTSRRSRFASSSCLRCCSAATRSSFVLPQPPSVRSPSRSLDGRIVEAVSAVR